jgi:hypothetical protein
MLKECFLPASLAPPFCPAFSFSQLASTHPALSMATGARWISMLLAKQKIFVGEESRISQLRGTEIYVSCGRYQPKDVLNLLKSSSSDEQSFTVCLPRPSLNLQAQARWKAHGSTVATSRCNTQCRGCDAGAYFSTLPESIGCCGIGSCARISI